MKRNQKFKRYGYIYAKRSGLRTVLTGVAVVAVVLALALLGWILYEPVRDFFLNDDVDKPASSQPASSASAEAEPSSSSAPQESESSADSAAESADSEPAPVVSSDGQVRAIYVTAENATDLTNLKALLGSASSAGIDTVMVEAKTASGIVCFDTENDTAVTAKAVSETAYQASQVASAIRGQNMTPMARLYVFRDATASSAIRDIAVMYGNSTTRWFDNSVEQGGKTWLNPCSEGACQYAIDLATELVSAGFDTIVLDGVQFPSGVGLDSAGYGVSGSFSKQKVLSEFITKITDAVEKAGGHVMIAVPAENIQTDEENKTLAGTNQYLYGTSPEQLAGDRAVLLLPDNDSAKELYALAQSKKSDTEWIAYLPAYSADGTSISMGEALGSLGRSDHFVLYNPHSTYLFR
jgi:hypothetical protein